jgi:hypothetical protein
MLVMICNFGDCVCVSITLTNVINITHTSYTCHTLSTNVMHISHIYMFHTLLPTLYTITNITYIRHTLLPMLLYTVTNVTHCRHQHYTLSILHQVVILAVLEFHIRIITYKLKNSKCQWTSSTSWFLYSEAVNSSPVFLSVFSRCHICIGHNLPDFFIYILNVGSVIFKLKFEDITTNKEHLVTSFRLLYSQFQNYIHV